MSFDQQSSNVNDSYPIGQDAWNRSKESREHPELHSTGHGTMSREWDTDVITEGPPSSSSNNNNNKQKQGNKEKQSIQSDGFGVSFGHTTRHVHSPRSIKRDLNNI